MPSRTRQMTILAVFMALVVIQTVVPGLGYIPTLPGFPVITLTGMTVVIGACLMGPRLGLLLGLFWGVLSLVRAYTMPATLTFFLFTQPLIAILPRTLCGGLIGWLAQFNRQQNPTVNAMFGLLGAAINTLGVITLASWLFGHNALPLLKLLGQSSTQQPLFQVLLAALGLNGLAEMLAAMLIVPAVLKVLNHHQVISRQ